MNNLWLFDQESIKNSAKIGVVIDMKDGLLDLIKSNHLLMTKKFIKDAIKFQKTIDGKIILIQDLKKFVLKDRKND